MNGTEPRPAVAPPTPEIPGELWMIWSRAYGSWVCATDVGRRTYLVTLSEADAQDVARHQNEEYDLNCVPVRVK